MDRGQRQLMRCATGAPLRYRPPSSSADRSHMFCEVPTLSPARLASGVHHERRRLVVDEILELPAELLERNADSRGELRELVRILEIVTAQADHVAARDGVPRGLRIDRAVFGRGPSRCRSATRTGSARNGRPASRSSPHCHRPEEIWPRSTPGRACTPCHRGSDQRTWSS